VAQEKLYTIAVDAATQYLADQSDEAAGRFVFAYTITIRNTGTVAAQLVSRHWIITDANNQVQEVKGQGVVGEQPYLRPNESFEYTSGTAMQRRSAPCAAAIRWCPRTGSSSMWPSRNSLSACPECCIRLGSGHPGKHSFSVSGGAAPMPSRIL
jgi:ApaG protein